MDAGLPKGTAVRYRKPRGTHQMTPDTRTPGPAPEPTRPALTVREVEVLVE